MGSNTPNGLPYPVGTDRVMDGDDAIKALATAVDPYVGDTGWQPVAFRAGFSSLSGNPCVYRRVGKAVYIRGVVSASFVSGALVVVADIPAAVYPTLEVRWITPNSATSPTRLSVMGTGAIQLQPYAAATWCAIDCTYLLG